MNLEDQICSLEYAKRLKELEVKQKSLFYYQNQPSNDGINDIVISIKEIISTNNGNSIMNTYSMDEFDEPIYSAFTVAELGEMLPNCILKPDSAPFDNYRLTIRKFISVDEKMNYTNNFITNYECDSASIHGADAWLTRRLFLNIYDSNLSNAMAKTLTYLLENGLIKNE